MYRKYEIFLPYFEFVTERIGGIIRRNATAPVFRSNTNITNFSCQ